jgi:NADPH:quinone reductase-like Zn-dependent oxidoreductase
MFSQRPFDAILDAVGTMSLFDHSPAYLKPEGLYVNVGAFEGKLYTLWCWLKNAWWPRILGGTPRKFIMFSTQQSRENAEELARLVKEGKLKVPIDSIFDMKDALLVR